MNLKWLKHRSAPAKYWHFATETWINCALLFANKQDNPNKASKCFSIQFICTKNNAVTASEERVEQDRLEQATFDLINHVQQRKGGKGGDRRDKQTTSPQPYQSQTKEEEGEIKGESQRLFTLSIMSGRLVAASTVTSRSCSMPSISVRSWARTRSPTPPEPEELKAWMRT